MGEELRVSVPRYQQIAVDIALQIAKGYYRPGERIYSRSLIASQYHVSPETARRAIAVLSDLEIVSAVKGSGVVILSREKALDYSRRYTELQGIDRTQEKISEVLSQQKKMQEELQELVSELLQKMRRFQAANPLLPLEIPIRKKMRYLGQTAAEINFWHNTGATIVGIRRGENLLLSPGPYARFLEGDLLLLIGDPDVLQRVDDFLYPPDEKIK